MLKMLFVHDGLRKQVTHAGPPCRAADPDRPDLQGCRQHVEPTKMIGAHDVQADTARGMHCNQGRRNEEEAAEQGS